MTMPMRSPATVAERDRLMVRWIWCGDDGVDDRALGADAPPRNVHHQRANTGSSHQRLRHRHAPGDDMAPTSTMRGRPSIQMAQAGAGVCLCWESLMTAIVASTADRIHLDPVRRRPVARGGLVPGWLAIGEAQMAVIGPAGRHRLAIAHRCEQVVALAAEQAGVQAAIGGRAHAKLAANSWRPVATSPAPSVAVRRQPRRGEPVLPAGGQQAIRASSCARTLCGRQPLRVPTSMYSMKRRV